MRWWGHLAASRQGGPALPLIFVWCHILDLQTGKVLAELGAEGRWLAAREAAHAAAT